MDPPPPASSLPQITARADDGRLTTPSAERNAAPLLAALRAHLPPAPRVLELAAGTGQHAAFLAAELRAAAWQPTDATDALFASVAAHAAHAAAAGGARVAPPRVLDVLDAASAAWVPRAAFDAVVIINLLHIAPPAATPGAMAVAAAALAPGGALVIYGPFFERAAAAPPAPSNADFDASLRARDARWGLRAVADVAAAAAAAGLALAARVEMPANNLALVFRAAGAAEAAAGGA